MLDCLVAPLVVTSFTKFKSHKFQFPPELPVSQAGRSWQIAVSRDWEYWTQSGGNGGAWVGGRWWGNFSLHTTHWMLVVRLETETWDPHYLQCCGHQELGWPGWHQFSQWDLTSLTLTLGYSDTLNTNIYRPTVPSPPTGETTDNILSQQSSSEVTFYNSWMTWTDYLNPPPLTP